MSNAQIPIQFHLKCDLLAFRPIVRIDFHISFAIVLSQRLIERNQDEDSAVYCLNHHHFEFHYYSTFWFENEWNNN